VRIAVSILGWVCTWIWLANYLLSSLSLLELSLLAFYGYGNVMLVMPQYLRPGRRESNSSLHLRGMYLAFFGVGLKTTLAFGAPFYWLKKFANLLFPLVSYYWLKIVNRCHPRPLHLSTIDG
jgi:hypothetical protein